MKLLRMFSTDTYKGTPHYIDSQKKYEILRTLLYFLISLSLFAAGYLTTKTKVNLLTIVAVLGCLPACKSLVNLILFLKFHSCPHETVLELAKHSEGLTDLFDMVFTTYDKNYNIGHMVLCGNTVVCYTTQEKFDESAFIKHLTDTMALENMTNITFKIFYDLKKYTQRLEQLKNLEKDQKLTEAVKSTLLSVSL